MARVKRGVVAKRRHKKVLEQAKGYYGNKSRSFRAANEQVMRSGQYAFRDRRARKGEFRRLWIQRINAATRQHDLSLQPVHRRPERGRHRGRPQDPRRSGRHRSGGVRRAGRGGQVRRSDRARALGARLHQPEGPTTAAPARAPQFAFRGGCVRRRGRRARPGGGRRRVGRSRRSSWRPASTPIDGAGPVHRLAPGVASGSPRPRRRRALFTVVRIRPTDATLARAGGLRRRRRRRRRSRQPRHDPALRRGGRCRRRRPHPGHGRPVQPEGRAGVGRRHLPRPGGDGAALADVRAGGSAAGRHVVAPRHRPHRRRLVGPRGHRRRQRGPRRRPTTRRSTSGCASSTAAAPRASTWRWRRP